jgi:LmbE family N-acetylglucosaminyl deacetylase
LAAQRLLGFGPPILGDFPNIALNAVPHIQLVQFVEQAIIDTKAVMLLTHHPRDLNDDHLHVARACMAAARLPQRRSGLPAVQGVLFCETLSSTEWSFPNGLRPFDPDTFVPVSADALDQKIKALGCYRGVMRERPHPRSADLIRAQAALRGSQCGHLLAEAFQTGFRVLSSPGL